MKKNAKKKNLKNLKKIEKQEKEELGKWIRKRISKIQHQCAKCNKTLVPGTVVYTYTKGFGRKTKTYYKCLNCSSNKRKTIPDILKNYIDVTKISLQHPYKKCYCQDCKHKATKWIIVHSNDERTIRYKQWFFVCDYCAKNRWCHLQKIETTENEYLREQTVLIAGIPTKISSGVDELHALIGLEPFDGNIIRVFSRNLSVFLPNLNYVTLNEFCQFSHCIEQMPLKNRRTNSTCPVYRHECPSTDKQLLRGCNTLRSYEKIFYAEEIDFKEQVRAINLDEWQELLLELYKGQITYAGGILNQIKMVGWEVEEELIRNALKNLANDKKIRKQKKESQKTGYIYYKLQFPPYQVYEEEMGVEEFNEEEFLDNLFWEEVETYLHKKEMKNKKIKRK